MTSKTTRLSPLILGVLLLCIPCGIAAQNNQPQEFALEYWVAQLDGPDVHLVSIPLKKRFSGDADITLQEIGPVTGFGISGALTIRNEATGLVRIVMVAEDGQEYLVLEAYSLTLDATAVSFRNACEETCVLTGVIPRRLRVEVVDATLETTSIAFNATGPGGPATRSAVPPVTDQAATANDVVRNQQIAARVKKLNESIAARRLRWVAGDTPIARLPYAEKKLLFAGGRVPNLRGFEYYVGGIFDMPGEESNDGASAPQSDIVSSFDWRSRHGANNPRSPYFDGDDSGSGWITSVKYQRCGDCWAHAAVGTVEAQTNLFFNQHLDLDLSEQQMVSCSGAGDCSGGWPRTTLRYIGETGAVDEACFPETGRNEPCSSMCGTPAETIRTAGVDDMWWHSEEEYKEAIVKTGPITFGFCSWAHVMVAVGFEQDAADGDTVWILKNSWGTGWGDNGYGRVDPEPGDICYTHASKIPIVSVMQPRSVACNDLDGDGYFNWGISAEMPDSCPPYALARKDCDDSDPTLYLFGQDGNCVPYTGGTTERVSVASDGTEGNRSSRGPSISADGRYVSFDSYASNLVPGDVNSENDVFVHDRLDGTTERVSVASDGTEGNVRSRESSISADGRYVSFLSLASNLVPGDANARNDVFVHDRLDGTTERVSVASDGTEGNNNSYEPSISADGRYVSFLSRANNLVPGDVNGGDDVFVHDRLDGTTERVSVASDGTEGNLGGYEPSISADGRYVSFGSRSRNLVPGDANGVSDVFVHDRLDGTTERVSVASDGTEGNRSSRGPSISADGRYVSFGSYASNLVPGDVNGTTDVFVHDRLDGTTERVSVASDGTEGNRSSWWPSISADGRYVSFGSYASNLVPGDVNGMDDVFVHDRLDGTTERVSVASDGAEGNSTSRGPSISADGRYVSFGSYASNLVPGDTNDKIDIFVRNLPQSIPDTVKIDVRPGDAINFVSPNFGMIPVAILSTSIAKGEEANFDAVQVDPATATLGPERATVAISSRNVRAIDVDGDGDIDLQLQFRASDTGIKCGDTDITLQARTYIAEPLTGEDSIRTIFCK